MAVTASAQVSVDHGDIDMMASALVEFADDVCLLLQCGMWTADEDTLRILGSKGRIEVPSAFFCTPGREGFSVQVEDDVRYETFPQVDHYTLQADTLAKAVLLGAPLRYHPRDPVRGAAALEACVQSFRTHARVEVVLDEPASR